MPASMPSPIVRPSSDSTTPVIMTAMKYATAKLPTAETVSSSTISPSRWIRCTEFGVTVRATAR